MIIKQLSKSEMISSSPDAWQLLSDNSVDIIKLVMKPGEEIETHKNPLKVIFLVSKGIGYFHVDRGIHEIKENSCILVEPELERAWKNQSDHDLEIFVIKFKA